MSVIDLGDERFRRDVARLHALGPRPVFELLVELGRERLLRTAIEAVVARYARLDPAALAAVRGSEIPSAAREIADCLRRARAFALDAEAVAEGEEALSWIGETIAEIEDAEAALIGAP